MELAQARIGQTVQDSVTGFKGTVTRRLEYISGSTQFAVQPKAKDGEEGSYPEAMFLDYHTLAILDQGIADALPSHTLSPDIVLGAEAQDKHSDFKGTIVALIYELNGCVSVGIQSRTLNKEGKPVIDYCNSNNVSIIKPVVKPVVKPVAKSKTGPAPIRGRSVPQGR